ncbi:MAG: helix-turn-helix transcriptional regulator [Phycisphaerales bacterium]|nr:helix-turn-helix transcriptional regulator [Phycisphaerales bacterium]
MTLFREHTGMSLGSYLTRQRLWQAQRLLATTDKSILQVATASGFGSLSRFYEAFAQECKTTPRAYRRALRQTPRL